MDGQIVKKIPDHFADIRKRLSKRWAKGEIDRWFAKEHQALGMRSPAHAIHHGQHLAVHSLVDDIERRNV